MLQIKDVYHILKPLPEPGEAILIGGQALNFWAEYYSIKDPSFNAYAPFISEDIDFLGGMDTAIAMQEAWHGKILIPDMDTHTPAIAKVNFKLKDERQVSVDFLDIMLGADTYHVKKEAPFTEIPDSQKTFKVLHPAHCLASRLINTYGILKRRSHPYGIHEAKRTELAIKVLYHYTCELFKKQDKSFHKDAYKLIEYTADLAAEDSAKQAYYLDKIDVLDAIPKEPALGMTKNFLNKRYPQIKDNVTRKRQRYIQLRQRIDNIKTPEPQPRSNDIEPGD